jgi:hypothetical protein
MFKTGAVDPKSNEVLNDVIINDLGYMSELDMQDQNHHS